MKVIAGSCVLKSKTKTGKLKFWRCEVVEEGGKFFTRSEYWQDGGKHQISVPYLVTPKNVGKKNETSGREQAILEMDSIIKKQKDDGYMEMDEDLDKENLRPLPMLAYEFGKRKNTVEYDAAGQPKLDGSRALQNSKVGAIWSRKGKDYIPEAVQHLYFDTKGYTFDGEIMIPHGDASFQESMSAVKKYRKGLSEKLRYYIYDIVIEDMSFKERYAILSKFKFPKNIVLVETVNIKNEAEFLAYHKKCVKNGFEGAMLRNWNANYCINHRSADLLKYKDFIDEEYKILEVIEAGEGSFKGCAKFIVEISKGITCDVNPEGTMEYKRELYTNRKNLIGKLLSVKFQGFTDKGSLRFPVGKAIRDYE